MGRKGSGPFVGVTLREAWVVLWGGVLGWRAAARMCRGLWWGRCAEGKRHRFRYLEAGIFWEDCGILDGIPTLVRRTGRGFRGGRDLRGARGPSLTLRVSEDSWPLCGGGGSVGGVWWGPLCGGKRHRFRYGGGGEDWQLFKGGD